MEPAILIGCALAGALVGVFASALPGLHVNLLAVALLALAPDAGEPGAAFLVAALAASPFGLALSATFLGGPGDDAALSALPAYELVREGRVREAVALQGWGALLGILLALPLALVARALLVPLAPRIAAAMPWLLLVILLALALSEPRRFPVHPRWMVVPWPARRRRYHSDMLDPYGLAEGRPEVDAERVWSLGPWSAAAGKLAALAMLLLSGALGLAAFRLGAASPFGWPSSVLLPLLAGLFALPSLVPLALAPPRRRRFALRTPRARLRELAASAWPGAAASVVLGLAPGVSASHAALLTPPAHTSERALVRLAAVNGGAIVFTLLAWHALDKARSGALVAAEVFAPVPAWPTWTPTPPILLEAALVVGAALVALLLARAASTGLARAPARPLAVAGLVLLVASVVLFNGALGLAILLSAGLVGALPARLGVRRSHAMGVILVPALLRAWGLA